ncbi:MAG: hypothetical protein A2138_01990 [Deltaproteobacteria bacterium RBG_16_71_12]|nr:MAG: hypothetical protein A2138_01990 [Deltaproteobacteria bacterium RBG_16_71_12]
MRRLSCLALVLAAMTALACGAPAPTAGNAYVTEGALGVIAGSTADDGVVRLIVVGVDVEDTGCSVDGLRYDRCTFTQTATVAYDGPLNLCELETDKGPTYAWECEATDSDSRIDQFDEAPVHCPVTGR